MILLTIENLSKTYGERVLFEDINLGIDEGDKIGLIGVNGTGKTTLLKTIAGIETPDAGRITRGSGIGIEYLPQNPEFSTGATVLEQVFKGTSPIMKVLRDYEEALEQAQNNSGHSGIQEQLIHMGQQMDALNAWQLESDAKSVLSKLGIADFKARVSDLSGGQRKRIALASALITPANLLILDEPTNHIDNDTVAWLEDFLNKRKGALLMVTHDRYFLDRVTNGIIELNRGKLYSYTGNYSQYLELKVQREEQLEAGERKRQSILRKELAWIRRGAKARTTKQKARIERFEQLSAQKTETAADQLEISVGSTRLGRKIVELENISKSFEDKAYIRNFSYILLKDDRVGIIGPNGCGKSTLLNIITGRVLPDSGSVEIGQTVKLGYFSQENSDMDENMRVIEYIKEENHYIPTTDGSLISAAQMLERFLFPGYLQWMPISKLSGGEKRRLQLLRVLMAAPNVLLLDEPTNDLDVQTLAILEDYLDDFPGAVIMVSHDRYFLDRLADRIMAFEDHGVIRQYIGGYSDYREQLEQNNREAAARNKEIAGTKQITPAPKQKERPRKFTYKEQQEFAHIDDIIAGVEEEIRTNNARINEAQSNYIRLQELTLIQKDLERRLDELIERWTYLNELAEEIKNSAK